MVLKHGTICKLHSSYHYLIAGSTLPIWFVIFGEHFKHWLPVNCHHPPDKLCINIKKKSPGRNKQQLGNVLMLPEHYQLDPACRCCVIGLPTATLRRQPVIKGPSKSLSMITRAVGLQGWGCCWNAGKRWETCCICRISLGKSSNYTKKGFTFTSFEYQIGCSQWLWFC